MKRKYTSRQRVEAVLKGMFLGLLAILLPPFICIDIFLIEELPLRLGIVAVIGAFVGLVAPWIFIREIKETWVRVIHPPPFFSNPYLSSSITLSLLEVRFCFQNSESNWVAMCSQKAIIQLVFLREVGVSRLFRPYTESKIYQWHNTIF